MIEFLLMVLILVCIAVPFVFNRIAVYFMKGHAIIISRKLSKTAIAQIKTIIAEDLRRNV